ncbi:tail fiber assembly protein [Candidatus Symbiopectobacterium sp.]|nr:tail fiber assembly protein [Candidatus Symbiopectobacterium sp.]
MGHIWGKKLALTEWQKYAVLLSRVDMSAADIEWQEAPEGEKTGN